MKTVPALLLYLLGATVALRAQCPTGPVLLTTQAQVNAFPTNFPGCTYLNVRFEVAGAGITDLTPLSQLTGTSKSFFINFNPDLTSLSGLDNMTEFLGDLTIEANHALTDLQGMGGLVTADRLLKIQNNNGLLSLDGLSAGGVLTHVGSLVVIENDELLDMGDVLDNLQTVDEYILFNKNFSLPSISTMNSLTSIGWYLSIEENTDLITLNAFHALTEVGMAGATWNFEVNKHASLTTLNDFFSLSTLGKNFSVSNNTALTELSFPSLTSIAGSMAVAANTSLTSLIGLGDFTLTGPLTITGNTSLPQCEAQGVCDYLNIVPPKTAVISNNAAGCNNRTQVETACSLLPVQLLSFNAKENNGDVLLTWQTASEKNSDYFQLERSTNGGVFTPIGRVAGKGATSVPSHYSFRDQQPVRGANYYRLKQVDLDGQYVYSPIVNVEIARGADIEIYPNPTTGYVKIKGELSEGVARLSDVTGRLISESRLPDEYWIDLTRQAPGTYLLDIEMGNERYLKRVVKE